MTNNLGLRLLFIFGLQMLLMTLVDFYYEYTFVELAKNNLHSFNHFVAALEQCFIFNQKVVIGSLSLIIVFQNYILFSVKQQFNKFLLLCFFLILAIDAYQLHTVVTKSEHFQAKRILNKKNRNLDNLKIRTYLYHYFKQKGDSQGMDIVVKNSGSFLNNEDAMYLLLHRKDAKFDNIVGQDELTKQ